jgi:hypothetical protein
MSIVLHNPSDLRRHIGLGISSFAVGVISVLSFVVLLGYAGMIHNTASATPAVNMTIGFGVMIVWLISLIGTGLGIAGALDSLSRKTFPVLGLVFNVGLLMVSTSIVAIGLRMA